MMPAGTVILIADDSEDDRYLLDEALRAARVRVPVRFVHDGRQAVDYLSGAGDYLNRAEHPLPGLVILDFQMPVMNGIEVLQWIRESRYKRLPVVMLSASSQPADIERAYDLHVNAYLMKPSSLVTLTAMMKAVEEFWLEYNEYPNPA